MNEFESDGLQNLEDVFRTASPEAKKINKLESQVKDAQVKIKELSEVLQSDQTQEEKEQAIIDYLSIFITHKEIMKTLDKMKSFDNTGKLSYCYSMLINKMDKLRDQKDDMESILMGV